VPIVFFHTALIHYLSTWTRYNGISYKYFVRLTWYVCEWRERDRQTDRDGEHAIFHQKKDFWVGCQWLIPVILATQEAEIRRISVRSQPEQIVLETLSPHQKSHKKGLVEWLKVYALSSNTSAAKKNFILIYCSKLSDPFKAGLWPLVCTYSESHAGLFSLRCPPSPVDTGFQAVDIDHTLRGFADIPTSCPL
jgi:hypothetical protein